MQRESASRACTALACLAACFAGACTQQSSEANLTVSGTATYRERMLLRPGSALEISVLDVSLADAPAVTVASTRVTDPGTPPFAFELAIEAAAVDPNRSYAVRATISANDELLMTTDTVYPILTRGNPNTVELVLRSVPRANNNAGTLGTLPATFTGVLPCADCPGIEYHLDLLEGSAFYLTRNYLDRDLQIDEIGSFSIDAAVGTLGIWAQGDAPTQLRIVDADSLRLLDREGQDIESSLNYSLTRVAFEPATLSLPLRGMYTYMADAGRFIECDSGRSFAVATEADNAALERAYLAVRREPGEALLVSFDAEVTMRPPMEGTGARPSVVVRNFTGVWPAETCGARMSRSDLLGTNWVLTRIGEESFAPAANARAPRMVLGEADSRVTGFGGCNNFNGEYEITGRSIEFGPIAATLRACAEGADIEARLFDAFERATGFELMRHHLELHDSESRILARFEGRALD